jgi:hypothetical protein
MSPELFLMGDKKGLEHSNILKIENGANGQILPTAANLQNHDSG